MTTLLDYRTGQQSGLQDALTRQTTFYTLDGQSGAVLPLSRFVAEPDYRLLLDYGNGAVYQTFNQASRSSAPLTALFFSDGNPLQFSDGQYLELAS